MVSQFDGATERVRGILPALVANESRRDRLVRIKRLAEDGVLDDLRCLARILEDPRWELPERLVELRHFAGLAIDRICREFEVQPVFEEGQSFLVTEQQQEDFDWSAESETEITFPTNVTILRSGWKTGDDIFVLPKVRVKLAPRPLSDTAAAGFEQPEE